MIFYTRGDLWRYIQANVWRLQDTDYVKRCASQLLRNPDDAGLTHEVEENNRLKLFLKLLEKMNELLRKSALTCECCGRGDLRRGAISDDGLHIIGVDCRKHYSYIRCNRYRGIPMEVRV